MQNRVRVVQVGNPDCHILKSTNQAYSCVFEYKGKTRMIAENGQYREFNSYDANPPKPFLLNWTKTIMFHELVYEIDKEKQTDTDRNVQKCYELFWKVNPICLENGKPHANTKATDQYNIIDANVNIINSTNRFEGVLKAANRLKEMTYTQICDVAYYYGKTPIGKTEEELFLELADMSSGFCLKAENLQEFLKVWVDNKSDDRDMLIVIKKAIAQGVITNKAVDGRNNYYLGESFMGTDEPGLIDWSRKNERDYKEHILRLVVVNDKTESKEEKSLSKQKTVSYTALEDLKRQAKELKLEGFIGESVSTATMGWDTLRPIVDAAVEKKNTVGV